MRSPVSFLDLFQEACRLALYSRITLFFGGLFGIVAWLGSKLNERLTPLITPETVQTEHLAQLWIEHQHSLLTIVGSALLLGGARALLRGPYFLLVENILVSKLALSEKLDSSVKVLRRSAWYSFLFEGLYWVGLTLIGLVITLPLLAALRFNREAFEFLAPLGLLLTAVLAVIFFYLKEFALFYTLLAKSKPRLSLELALRLLQKHTWLILLFGLFLIALTFLFTFAANLAIIASDFIPVAWLRVGLIAISTIGVLGISASIEEALRLLFFHALAATPKPPVIKVGSLVEEKNPESAPTI